MIRYGKPETERTFGGCGWASHTNKPGRVVSVARYHSLPCFFGAVSLYRYRKYWPLARCLNGIITVPNLCFGRVNRCDSECWWNVEQHF